MPETSFGDGPKSKVREAHDRVIKGARLSCGQSRDRIHIELANDGKHYFVNPTLNE